MKRTGNLEKAASMARQRLSRIPAGALQTAVLKRPRFEVLKMKVPRGDAGSSIEVANVLSQRMKKNQRLVYLKHNTLVGKWAYWTAILENREEAK